MALARVLVGTLGVLFILGGIAAAAATGPGGSLASALFLFVPGALMIAAVILERTRYRSLRAERTGAAPGPAAASRAAPEPRFRPTDERFVDPTTHVAMRVWVDPATGERRYVPEG